MAPDADERVTSRHRSYTTARRHLTVLARNPLTGQPWPFGAAPHLLQAGAAFATLAVLVVTVRTWGVAVSGIPYGVGYLAVIFGVPAVVLFALRRPKAGGRFVWHHGAGLAAYALARLRVRGESRRVGRGVGVGGKVWVGR